MGKKIGQLLLAAGIDLVLLLVLLHGTLGRGFCETTKTGASGTGYWESDREQETVRAFPEEKVVALTFDDGPHPVCTKDLLDGLKKRGVEATFFLMGSNIEGNEDIVRRMQKEGHLIGNHGYRHVQMTGAGVEKVADSVEKTSQIIKEITGEEPEYLRPPYGDWNEELAESIELTPVFWSVDSLDWKYQNTPGIASRVLKKVENGDIILMHDIFPTSVEAALEIVDTLLEQGYTFVTADELIID